MILVTGGAGYIGSHTVKALRLHGFDPVIFDDFSTGHHNFIQQTACVEGSLANPADLERAFSSYPIEGVLHFAGKALVPESHTNPGLYYRTNVTGGVNLLEAMVRFKVRDIIFSSTCATYGIPETVPITEDCRQRPINPYGETKLAFERALRWYGESYGLRLLSLRYFNAAGADAQGEFGEDHSPETHLIPLVLDAAMARKSEVKIFGTDYPTPDGTCVRDYIHVTDLALAHVAGLEALRAGTLTEPALNLGTGQGYSVREVINTAKRITGRDLPVVEAARREGDPPFLVAAVERAQKALNWKAGNSSLEQIIASAWKWHQNRFA
jgi:UDP-glucose 4-epimerase